MTAFFVAWAIIDAALSLTAIALSIIALQRNAGS
jgi:hypothetical protein